MAPRKDYNKKMRNLYISLFESNIIDNSPINEGAWGYGILDNDTALDKQTQFGEFSLKLLTTKINTSVSFILSFAAFTINSPSLLCGL